MDNPLSTLHRLCKELVNDFDAASLVTDEGETLHIKYETLGDIGTLSSAAQTVLKYYPLKIDEFVLLNDPYSGGTLLSSITLVTPLYEHPVTYSRIFLVARSGFRPRISLAHSLEEEGLRIPPTPIAQHNILNETIMEAILQHPQCPENFETKVRGLLQKMLEKKSNLDRISGSVQKLFSKSVLNRWFMASKDTFQNVLAELPSGDIKVENKLETGEILRLKLEVSPDKLSFDFSNTSTSKKVCLTDAATFGACVGAVCAFLREPFFMNSGSISLFGVETPLGSMLNAKYPLPTFRGMTEGVVRVAGLVLRALSELSPKRAMSFSSQNPVQLQFQFGPQKHFYESLPGGISANIQKTGAEALHFWTRNQLRSSVQEIEVRFPLRILHVGARKNSGGAGQFRGGDGLIKKYQILEDAEFHWIAELRRESGANCGQPTEIKIQKLKGDLQTIKNTEGHLKLSAGDEVHVHTAGGPGISPTTRE